MKSTGYPADDYEKVCTGMYVNYLHGQIKYVSVYGDCNGDGVVDSNDQSAISGIINRTGGSITDAYCKSADMDFSGRVNVSDIMTMKNYLTSGLGTAEFLESEEFENCFFNRNYIPSLGLSGYKSITYATTYSKEDTIAAMKRANVFGFGGHGRDAGDRIFISDNIYITKSDISALSNNALSGCRLALFDSCSTAAGGADADNFLNAVYSKGTKTAIGFSQTIYSKATYSWTGDFLNCCSFGHSIEEACLEANYNLFYNTKCGNERFATLNGLVVLGNKTQRIGHPAVLQDKISPLSLENDDPMEAFESNLRKEFNDNGQKGYYDLAAFHEADSSISAYSIPKSNTELAKEALSDYIDIAAYNYIDEYYNESLNVYTVAYSKLINGIESTDSGYVMIKNGTVIAVSATNTGAFDSVNVPEVTDEQALNYLASQLVDKDYTMDGYNYCLDDDGNPALAIGAVITENDCSYGETVIMPLL